MKKRALAMILVLCMVLAVMPVAFAAGEYEGKTVILHSNDVHGAVEGYAYIAALKADYIAKGAEVILADAGDYSQGTTYVSVSKGLDAVALMNSVGYDVVSLGNHEFDYGYEQLAANMAEANFTVLCADVLKDGEPIFDANTIIEKGGVKIGFFGLETPETKTKANPALIQGLTFLSREEMYACAQAQVDELKAAGADIVVCLSHLGVDAESEPNRSVDLYANTTGIDFVIDAHSHTVMTEGENGEPIQSTGTKFANIGVIVIDNATKKIEKNELVAVYSTVTDAEGNETEVANFEGDAKVAADANAIVEAIKAAYDVVFAKSEVELNGDKAPNGNRDSETNNGDLITDSMIWALTEKNPGSITEVDADHIVAITNGGGIRAWIHTGDITKNDVNTVLPFGNTLAVVYVTGAELLEALEASTYCTPGAVGGFPQIAGMNITIKTYVDYDANEETYPDSEYFGPKSIQRVTINSVNGKPFDEKATYAVVTNNFSAAGGDTYYAFASAASQFDTGLPLDEVLMEYITVKLNGVVGQEYAEPQGRIILAAASDVTSADWFYSYVSDMKDAGVIKGYLDGSFKPKGDVTWGEALKMVTVAVTGAELENGTDHWASNYMKAAIEAGWMDAEVELNSAITRAEMCDLMAKAMGLAASEAANPFLDEANGYAVALFEAEIVTGTTAEGGVALNGSASITRAEIATIVWRVYQAVEAAAAEEAPLAA